MNTKLKKIEEIVKMGEKILEQQRIQDSTEYEVNIRKEPHILNRLISAKIEKENTINEFEKLIKEYAE